MLGSENIDREGNFTPNFMRELASTNEGRLQETIDKCYSDSDTFYASNPEARRLIPPLRERDDELEPRLRDVVAKSSGTTVFICGNHHSFADYEENLYERIRDLSPIRVRLLEVDKF